MSVGQLRLAERADVTASAGTSLRTALPPGFPRHNVQRRERNSQAVCGKCEKNECQLHVTEDGSGPGFHLGAGPSPPLQQHWEAIKRMGIALMLSLKGIAILRALLGGGWKFTVCKVNRAR